MGKMTLSQMVAQLAGGMGTSIQIFVVTLVFSLLVILHYLIYQHNNSIY